MNRLVVLENGSPLYGRLFKPELPGFYPGVILLHGTYGIHPDQLHYAQMLANQGYVCLLPSYYRGVGKISKKDRTKKLTNVIRNAVKYLQALPDVQSEKIGLVGFSQGGFLAIRTAGTISGIKAIVEYYGWAPDDIDDYVKTLPPILILHGVKDTTVPISAAHRLYKILTRQGRPVKIHLYPEARHNFNHKGLYYNAEADADARQRTLRFLERHLKPPEDQKI